MTQPSATTTTPATAPTDTGSASATPADVTKTADTTVVGQPDNTAPNTPNLAADQDDPAKSKDAGPSLEDRVHDLETVVKLIVGRDMFDVYCGR